ncbi:hypothetical protein [Nocardia cyriacigeorgica]|uniref:hypothetical protein n=1 Tax=Nocardia cyriacigeorgica TaxID=135487 RepID=UPI001892E821|nr:hypothetical protein [Nocardia cyriacigeorgica]MBF6453138.1 hypothetical protein [Nocardia cyriacigeorgica]MBF6480351.1 hypothetical protein [Nocardia cyriacigeorgica]MBF6550307.1 hypothetical protein [Nocardia cyriacigeorgica]
MLREFLDKGVVSALDRAAHAQAPVVTKYAAWLRDRHPEESPDEIVRRLERQYLIAVTASGVGVGLSAAVPGVGTVVALFATGADTLVFLEASSVLATGAAAVHGMTPEEVLDDHLVSAVVLGQAGTKALGQTAGHAAGKWVDVLGDRIPVLNRMDDSYMKRFLVQFVVKRGALMFGKVIPAGIGAVIGGVGNNALGRTVIANLRTTLGPATSAQEPAPVNA